MSVRTEILKARIKEWLLFDSAICISALGVAVGISGLFLYVLGSRRLSFRLLSAVHRTGRPQFLCGIICRTIARGLHTSRTRSVAALDSYFHDYVQTAPQRANPALAANPQKMLKNMAIVLASAQAPSRRGVIAIKYNYAFPFFAHEFGLQEIAKRYHIVLEPSWSGYCTEDVLCYTQLRPRPVFVQSAEIYDGQFLNAIQTNLRPVPISSNWWVDHRVLSPDTAVEKDLDFVMVASWADFKRHHRFFHALQKLRQCGHRLNGACVGYPAGSTVDVIKRRAKWYGVDSQIEFHDFVPQGKVAEIMNRAKTNIVWSRKEGVNRVIIEGMFCGIPCIIPEGFNYGYQYPYINEQTGRFSSDARLPQDLIEMTRTPWPHSPADWVRNHMTPQHATAVLSDTIHQQCQRDGEEPPEELSVKVNGLNGMNYWDDGVLPRYEEDYAFLRSQFHTPPPIAGQAAPAAHNHVELYSE